MASLLKNVASQNITFTLVSATTGAALTSATFTSLAWVTKDNTQAGFAGTFTTLGNGQYNYAPTQAETNCTDFGLLVTVSGAIPVNLDFHTDLATPLTGAQIATAVWTDTTAGDFTTALSVGKSVMNGVSLGTGLTINGYTGNTPQTGDSYARIGAAGAGLTAITGVTLAASQPGVTIPTVTTVTNQLTAAAIARGFGKIHFGGLHGGEQHRQVSWRCIHCSRHIGLQHGIARQRSYRRQRADRRPGRYGVWQDTTAGDFTVASSIGKSLFTSGAVPGASGGLFIAGSNAATTVNFTGNLSGSVGSVTGNVGGNVVGSAASVTGSVGSISGVTFPTNFSSLSINGSGYVTITSDIKQGVSATVVFTMTDSTTHAPKTGIGSSFTRNEIYKGGGAGAGTTNMPSEVGDGWYSVVLTASETNATSIALTFEASGADQLNMLLIPQA